MKSTAPTGVQNDLQRVLDSVDALVVGKTNETSLALMCLLAGGHLLIEDVPGVGKTTLALAMAKSLGLLSSRVQFTSDLLPADIIGVSIFDQQKQDFRFHAGPIFTQLLLADEINRAPPRTQSALLESMEERTVSIDGNVYTLDKPMFVIATQNPTEQLGVYPLPESQLDRFLATIELGYPDQQSERALLSGSDTRALIDEIQPVATADLVNFWQARARQIHVSGPVLDYIQALLAKSRKMAGENRINNGLSPRAGLSLLAMSRARALLQHRDMVLPDDVQQVFSHVAAHRLAGSLRAGLPVTQQILNAVAVP